MTNDRLSYCACLASPLIVAVVIVSGLISLSAENLAGRSVTQVSHEHSTAVHHLMFRP